jgi:hypothetical protein
MTGIRPPGDCLHKRHDDDGPLLLMYFVDPAGGDPRHVGLDDDRVHLLRPRRGFSSEGKYETGGDLGMGSAMVPHPGVPSWGSDTHCGTRGAQLVRS